LTCIKKAPAIRPTLAVSASSRLENTMATRTGKTHDPDSVTGIEPMFDLYGTLVTNAMQLQRAQLDAWLSWQKSWAANGQELFDEWACRFGGGIPIDG
jgi:hypothetical protein